MHNTHTRKKDPLRFTTKCESFFFYDQCEWLIAAIPRALPNDPMFP